MQWNDQFMSLFCAAVDRYHENRQSTPESFFLRHEADFLATIGYLPEEMYAYIEDFATTGAPSPSTALLIAAVRRNFFLIAQRGCRGEAAPVRSGDLPAESEEFHEIAYLPRIVRKAAAKLFGTLSPDLMYGCAKDRAFLRTHGDIHPADFLQLVWQTHADTQKMVQLVLDAMKQQQEHEMTIAEPEPPAEGDACSIANAAPEAEDEPHAEQKPATAPTP